MFMMQNHILNKPNQFNLVFFQLILKIADLVTISTNLLKKLTSNSKKKTMNILIFSV